MKIGILSMQRVHNYGSFLQAYALKKILEEMGHEIKYVDIECAVGKNVQKQENKIGIILKKIKYCDKYFFRRVKNSRKNKELAKLFKNIQERYLGLSNDFDEAIGCDAVVIGSDEIFNCDSDSTWGITGQRFGNIPYVPCVFSYAASCGYTNIADVNIEDRQVIIQSLKKMKKVSVRDKNTSDFVEYFLGSKPEINLDPVLIYDFAEEIRLGFEEGVPQNPYMVVYAYHNRIDSPSEIRAIKMYAKKNGLKTIAIGGALPWCDEFAILSPFQVLAYFKNARCIVTDTFHGTVIAAKFNKSFAVLVRESNANKLQDLLKRLSIEKHSVKMMNDLEKILDSTVDFEVCNKIIGMEKEHTKEYLKQVLIRD